MMVSSDLSPGPGEARSRQRRRRMIIFYSLSGFVGLALGFGLAMVEQGEGNFIKGDIAALSLEPAAAIIVALGFLVGLFAMPMWGFTQLDEHQLKNNLVSMSAGCMAAIAGYPIWATLAIGGLLPLPTAFGIFLLAFITMAVAYGVMRLRA